MKKLVSLFIAIVMMSCAFLTIPVSAGYIYNCPYPSCQKPADLCVCVGCNCRNPNNLASRKITNEQLAEMIADGTICIYNSDVALYRYLSLSDNLISDINPLAELTNLGNLSLDKNQIADISPLASLTGLEWLFLSDNAITDISSLAGLTNLRGLWLEGNSLSLTQINTLQAALPDCEIFYDYPNGHVLGKQEIKVADAVQIFMYLAKMEASVLYHDENAYNAACIVGNEPSVADAVQIFMYLAGMEASLIKG